MMHLKYLSFRNLQVFFLAIIVFACSGAEKEHEEMKTHPNGSNG